MSKRSHQLLLEDMLESARKIKNYCQEHTLKSFLDDEKTKDAVARNFKIRQMKSSNILVRTIALMLVTTTATFAQSVTGKVQTADTTKTIETKVKGITCSTDLKMISANVEKLKGVNTCKAGKTGPTSTFEIAYNPSLITEKEIYAVIENTGSCENPDERPYKIKQ